MSVAQQPCSRHAAPLDARQCRPAQRRRPCSRSGITVCIEAHAVAPLVRSCQSPALDERRTRIVLASAPPSSSRTDTENASAGLARKHPGIEPGQAATDLLADLEHVLRVPRPAVRLRAPERKRQPHIPDAGRGNRADSAAVDPCVALLLMPRSSSLWVAAGLLWLLDASINVSMEPFRAFVGDQLGPTQRAA